MEPPKIKVYSDKVLLCGREKTEEASGKVKIGRKHIRKHIVRWLLECDSIENETMKLEIEESEEEQLRRRIKE